MRPKDTELDDLGNLTDILNDLGIDGRTKPAIKVTRIKRALKTGGAKAFIEIFTANIALNLMIENELVKELMQKGEFIDDEGNLSPAISKDLLKLRNDTLSYLKMLQSVQNKTGETSNTNPLADLLNAE
ncbi:MAG: hypothetical protein RBR67_17815 [Desulfobacterium sp.]|nr:hypothetical protein [Desulfobacterium sp.]